MAKIFISYRRQDDAGFTHALHGHLTRRFEPGDIFMDVQGHIKPGDNFAEAINGYIDACDIMLVIIGPTWVARLDSFESGQTDWVLHEVSHAIATRKRVIPVRIDNAALPSAAELPLAIAKLPGFHAVDLRPDKFTADAAALTADLDTLLHPPAEADRVVSQPPGGAPEHETTFGFGTVGKIPAIIGTIVAAAIIGQLLWTKLSPPDDPDLSLMTFNSRQDCLTAANANMRNISKCYRDFP